ncbi:MAG: pilus assembly protein N-terminal domain-containing protein, partial [Candidatus Omnitrophica bacterium]|nr:pilus assembly protein N-terminal domain-containing protein [Candidatus Omnitrophota bacterium]
MSKSASFIKILFIPRRLPEKLSFSLESSFLIFAFFFCIIVNPQPVFAYSQIAGYLCEEGIKDLKKGNFQQAEEEFNRALIAEPGYPPAIYYLGLISEELNKGAAGSSKPALPDRPSPAGLDRQAVMENALDQVKVKKTIEKEGISPSQIFIPELREAGESGTNAKIKTQAIYLLNDPRLPMQQPIEIEEGKYVIITGSNIKRFLVVQPDILYAERLNDNEISVTAKNRGLASIIIWDDNGRTSIECTGIMPVTDSPTLEETMRKEEENMGNFKFRYNLDWYSYYTGRRLQTVRRNGTYSWIHNLNMYGATPYGLVDAAITERTLSTSTDMTYVSAGLTNGKLGDFKGFNLRAGDYNPYFNNLAIPGADLRGVYFYSPAFDNKFDYTFFWGRENGGRYGTLATETFDKAQHSFMSGINLNFSPETWQNYKFSVAHGWGRDRQDFLKDYAYDLIGSWNVKNYGYSYEIASDTKNLAQILTSRYNGTDLYVDLQFR